MIQWIKHNKLVYSSLSEVVFTEPQGTCRGSVGSTFQHFNIKNSSKLEEMNAKWFYLLHYSTALRTLSLSHLKVYSELVWKVKITRPYIGSVCKENFLKAKHIYTKQADVQKAPNNNTLPQTINQPNIHDITKPRILYVHTCFTLELVNFQKFTYLRTINNLLIVYDLEIEVIWILKHNE